jgi:hypothetical protein
LTLGDPCTVRDCVDELGLVHAPSQDRVPEISLHRGLVVKRRDRYEGVRDHDANSAARR